MRLVEDYRPKTLDDIVGQDLNVVALKSIVARKNKDAKAIPHMLFIGSKPGTGKTSAAIGLAVEIWGDEWEQHFKELNASDERGIDVVRTYIKQVSSHKGNRILFLTEADHLTSDAQGALRRIMEMAKGTIFILDGNKRSKIVPAIQSRCSIFKFKRLTDEVVLKRVLQICKLEGIALNLRDTKIQEGLKALAKQSGGDLRSALNTLETIINQNREITVESLLLIQRPRNIAQALQKAVEGDFTMAKEMITNAFIDEGSDATIILEELFEALESISDEDVRKRLYSKLGEVDRGCATMAASTPSNHLIQLIDFIAYAWVAPRLMRCAALERDK